MREDYWAFDIGRCALHSQKQPSISCMASIHESRFSGPPEHRFGKSSPGVLKIRALTFGPAGKDLANLDLSFQGITAEYETVDNLVKEVGLNCTISADPTVDW